MLRAAGRCPTADRTFRARNSRMELAELVLCESRGPVSFIKHLFIFGLFQYAEGWIWWPLPMRIRIGSSDRLLLRAFEREGIPRFSRSEAHSQMGSVRPLTLESQADSLPGGQDYMPAQKHFVNIFSAQPLGRFNSLPLGPETQENVIPANGSHQ